MTEISLNLNRGNLRQGIFTQLVEELKSQQLMTR